MIDVQREKQRIAQAKLLSPMTGWWRSGRTAAATSCSASRCRTSAKATRSQPGMPVADVLDLSELEVVAKVGELDRANLHEGQEVSIALDAIPDKEFHGKIKGMSGTASANVFSGDPAKKFDVIFSIDMRQLLTALGVKPAEIEQIMATAERNAKKAPAASPMSLFAAMGGGGGGRQARGPRGWRRRSRRDGPGGGLVRRR